MLKGKMYSLKDKFYGQKPETPKVEKTIKIKKGKEKE